MLAGGIQTDNNICILKPANFKVRLSIVVGWYQWCLSRKLLGSLFTPFIRSVDHVLRLQSQRFWPLLSEQHGPADGWRERDVDRSTAWMLASKGKAGTKLSAQLNKLGSSSQEPATWTSIWQSIRHINFGRFTTTLCWVVVWLCTRCTTTTHVIPNVHGLTVTVSR